MAGLIKPEMCEKNEFNLPKTLDDFSKPMTHTALPNSHRKITFFNNFFTFKLA